MYDRIIQLLMLAVATTSLIITLLPPPAPISIPRTLYAGISPVAAQVSARPAYPGSSQKTGKIAR